MRNDQSPVYANMNYKSLLPICKTWRYLPVPDVMWIRRPAPLMLSLLPFNVSYWVHFLPVFTNSRVASTFFWFSCCYVCCCECTKGRALRWCGAVVSLKAGSSVLYFLGWKCWELNNDWIWETVLAPLWFYTFIALALLWSYYTLKMLNAESAQCRNWSLDDAQTDIYAAAMKALKFVRSFWKEY